MNSDTPRSGDNASSSPDAAIPGDLVTIPDAARLARVAECTIRRWVTRGRLRLWGHPRAERVSLAEVLPPARSRRKATYYDRSPGDPASGIRQWLANQPASTSKIVADCPTSHPPGPGAANLSDSPL